MNSNRCIYTVSSKSRLEDAFLFTFQLGRKDEINNFDFYIFLSENISDGFEIEIPEYFLNSTENVNIKIIQPSSFSDNFFVSNYIFRTELEKVVSFKAYALAYLFELNTYNCATYFDTDVYIVELLDLNISIGKNLICIAPHTTDYYNRDINIYLRDGGFNSGYFIFNLKHDQAINFINYFSNFCRAYCYHDRNLGLFVDQKAFDLAQMFFDIHVIRNTNTNRAYWNLNEANQSHQKADSFFHFSGLNHLFFEKLSIHSKNNIFLDIDTLNCLTDYFFLKKTIKSTFIKQIKIDCSKLLFFHEMKFTIINFESFSEDYYASNQFKIMSKIIGRSLKKIAELNIFRKLFKMLSDERFLKNN